ncbi:MAG: hypothetical protein WC662_04925 [Candidatus Paceibacterota bacterium]
MIKRSSILSPILIIFGFLMFSFLFTLSVNAQLREADIVLELFPKYPRANEEIRASISTPAIDLNKTKISWILNGELIKETIGQKDFSFRAGDTNTQTTIEVQIQTLEGIIVNKKITVAPADVDLLWEAQDSYVPPFYKGKAMMPSQGKIKVVAIPNSSENKGLVYSWKLDEINKQNSSGFGKNSYTFQNSYLDTKNTIETTVTNIQGNNVGSGKIVLAPRNPKILFYKKDVAQGTRWEKVLDNNFFINTNGETIVVEPYFFSPKNLNANEISLKWLLAGNEIDAPSVKNELSIKPGEDQSGSSTIKVIIENVNRLFLTAEKEINVKF